MIDYLGAHCPVCDKKFTQNDDIVVCPDCGTPHHRECYNQLAKCANEEKHGIFDGWKNDSKIEEAKYDGKLPFKCPSCGTLNKADNLYCQICGSRLNENPQNANADVNVNNKYNGPIPIIPNPFTTPFGGLSPDDDIYGISAREYALFVGQNSFYYLPKFKDFFIKAKRPSWNWSAFFFESFYFLYRKMYLIALAVLALKLILLVPTLTYIFQLLEYAKINPDFFNTLTPKIPEHLLKYVPLINVFNWIAVVFKGLLAMFANKIYYLFSNNKIKKIRHEYTAKTNSVDYNSNEYAVKLSKGGRVNRKLILIILGSYAAICFIYFVFLTIFNY